MGEVFPIEKIELNKYTGLSVALGCFDGVHRGHQTLLARAADKEGLMPAVWTFSEPLTFPFIDNVQDRVSAFGRYGMELAICESFLSVKTLTPENFVKRLVEEFNVKHFVCGEDFRFGINRTGGADTLCAYAEKLGATAEILPPLMSEIASPDTGEKGKISSTLIRKLLAIGNVELAQELLGRPFAVRGRVVQGKHIGRTMKLPTVNQTVESGRVVLKYGVYDSVTVIDGARFPSVTNFGTRPTVNDDKDDITCETHIIGENIDLYGKNITVLLCRYAREERKYDSLDSLKAAVNEDITRARIYFENLSK